MRIKTTAVYFLLSLFPGIALAGSIKKTQQSRFRVIRGGETIGFLKTSEVIQDNRTAYFLQSDVNVNMVMKVHIVESIADVFEANRLTHSVHTRYVNGKIKASNTLKKDVSGYQLDSSTQYGISKREEIALSILSLYYHEPKDGDRVYSQNFRTMLSIEKTEPGKYCIELPNGNTTTYIYYKGILQTVESQTLWGKIVFEKEQQILKK